MATSIIAAIQAKYDALTSFTGKPPVLWPGLVRLKNPDGTAVNYPVIRFTCDGVPWESTLEDVLIETWGFTFEVLAETLQQAQTIYDRVMFNGTTPILAGAAGGFYKATSLSALPSSYVFMDFEPEGPWRPVEVLGQWTGEAVPVWSLSWKMNLTVQRIAFSGT